MSEDKELVGANSGKLTEKQEQQALAIKSKLDLSKPDSIFQFGLEPQNKLAATSDEIIKTVKTKDSGSLNNNLTALETLFRTDKEQKSSNPLVKGWHHIANKLYEQKVRHQNLSVTIENISKNLKQNRNQLSANNKKLYELYVSSLNQAENLKPYIAAGQMTMNDLKNSKLPALKEQADQGDLSMQGEYHRQLFIYHRLSRRVNDLILAQQANINLAAQVNAADIANNALIEKVNETVNLLVPLWKGNSAVQIMTQETAQTSKILKRIDKFSNDQLEESSKRIHDLTVQAYQDQEKGLLELDTLKNSSETIISAIKSCRDIAQQGEEQRAHTVKTVNEIANRLRSELSKTGKQIEIEHKNEQ